MCSVKIKRGCSASFDLVDVVNNQAKKNKMSRARWWANTWATRSINVPRNHKSLVGFTSFFWTVLSHYLLSYRRLSRGTSIHHTHAHLQACMHTHTPRVILSWQVNQQMDSVIVHGVNASISSQWMWEIGSCPQLGPTLKGLPLNLD